MAQLSPARLNVAPLEGLQLLNRGKVRDTYDLGDNLMLIVATDGISIFDFVLNALVSEKGAVLNALSHFWFRLLEKKLGIRTHIIAAGAAIDAYLPEHLWCDPDLQSRAMIVQHLNMAPVEFIYRKCLTGSGLKEYQKTGRLAGVTLPGGFQDGDQLPEVIFDPTDKAENGHDERISLDAVRAEFPEEVALGEKIYATAIEHARRCRIIIADTKFEIGRNAFGNVTLGDEVLTPDSSRFWAYTEWAVGRTLAKRKAPSPQDKQFIRDFGIEQGINKLDPKNPEDVATVHALIIPQELIEETTKIYRYIFWRLTGMLLEKYQRDVMGIHVKMESEASA